MSWSTDNTVFVMVPWGYNSKPYEEKGFRVFSPYTDKSIVTRLIRELWFRLPGLPNRYWYNTCIIKNRPQYILINDPLITVDFLEWLHKELPSTQINLTYGNMVGKAKNLNPKEVPDYVRMWTYDDYDSRKYNIQLYPYCVSNGSINKKEPEYDVFFVGRDKGRGEWLLDFEKQLKAMGLKTKFIITKSRRVSKNKAYYQKEISYEEVLDYDSKSRAILNIVMENQEGVTMRDLEATSLNIKLITNNKNIVKKDIYNPKNVFVLGIDDLNSIVDFIRSNPDPIPEELFKKHSFEGRMDVITREQYR